MYAGQPRAGRDYPRSVGEFQSWFATDADCLDYLEWLRWPEGFVCPVCRHAGGWAVGDGRHLTNRYHLMSTPPAARRIDPAPGGRKFALFRDFRG